MDSYNPDIDNSSDSYNGKVFVVIGVISLSVLAFLVWLIYFKQGAKTEGGGFIDFLPILNAFLNALTSIFLVTGIVLIKQNKLDWHKRFMLTATFTSTLFLMSYITYHHFHGDSKFVAMGLIRPIYFGILISHILLSAIQVPLILATLYLALTRQYVKHKKVAKITFPIWLYVSVTGVIIFIILRWFNF